MVSAPFPNPPRIAPETSFADCLRQVRRRLVLKQTSLSLPMGCSDAAISLWEAGQRLPRRHNLERLLEAIDACGATAEEHLSLRQAWARDRSAATFRPRAVVTRTWPLLSMEAHGA